MPLQEPKTNPQQRDEETKKTGRQPNYTIKTKARIYLIPRKMKTLSTKREQQQTINKQQHNGQLPMGLDRIYFIVKVFANCFAVVLTQIRLHSDNYDALAELSLCTD